MVNTLLSFKILFSANQEIGEEASIIAKMFSKFIVWFDILFVNFVIASENARRNMDLNEEKMSSSWTAPSRNGEVGWWSVYILVTHIAL